MKLRQMMVSDNEIGLNTDTKLWNLGKYWCQIMKFGQMLMANDEIWSNVDAWQKKCKCIINDKKSDKSYYEKCSLWITLLE